MHLILDAVVFEFPPTGIAKVTAGLCSAAMTMDNALAITAIHRRPLRPTLPRSIRTHSTGRLLPYRLWRSYAFRKATTAVPVALFPWNGDVPALAPGVTCVSIIHDVLPLVIPGHFATSRDEHAYRTRIQRDIDRTHLLFTDSVYSRNQIIANFRTRHEPRVLRFGPTLLLRSDPSLETRDARAPFFLYVGGYDKRKGIEQLLEVFVSLHKEKKITSRLVLTGTQKYFSESFRNLVATGREMQIVEERGYVDDETLVDLLQNAVALVYPSRFEGFGLPPLEAMSVGCPVITTRQTSLPEVCGDAVLYVDPDNRAAFGDALLALERNPSLREELRAKGLRQAETFSWNQAAETFLTALGETLKNRERS